MMRRSLRAVLTAAILLTVLATLAASAVAHETAKAGDLALEVGWGTEPAYVGQLNTVQLVVTREPDGDPVNDPGAELVATVSYGDRSQEFPLAPTYYPELGTGTPGEYAALVIPTAPGDYTFRVTGTIEGVKVDLEVESSPKTFSPVEEASAVQFPVKVPGTEQVAQRLEAELARVATADDVSAEVSSAKTIGYVGIAVGAVGVALAVVALLRRRA
jgi:hypothetical protein